MTDREKLVELLDMNCGYVAEMTAADLADYLISNGVTVKEPQKPLTAEELWEYHGEFIWKEELSMKLVPVKMVYVGAIAAEYEEFGVEEECGSPIRDYNYSWRCWTEKPTEEERRNAKWEE